MYLGMIAEFVGGLGLFLFGMQMMASGMQKAAGDRLRRILEALTSRPWLSVITGAVVTVLLQSSSTATVMIVGFANSGIVNLFQAAGTVMGANIGTTVTAQVISFEIGVIALPAVGIGALVNFFGRRRLYKYLGQALLGFGLLILGMTVMSGSMEPLTEVAFFKHMLVSFSDYPLLGILGGAIFTALLQSSSAATGVIIALSGVEGLISFESALPLIVGTNLGTCITALIASLGTNLSAKRVAAAHVIFNVIGVILILFVLSPFSSLVFSVSGEGAEVPRQVANAHTIFNVMNTIIVFPFFKYFIALVEKVVPGEEVSYKPGARYLDRLILKTPAAAISGARQELVRMANIAREMVEEATNTFLTNEGRKITHVNQMEDMVDGLEEEITVYLSELSQHSLARHQSNTVSRMFNAANDLERIGDHAQNILHLAELKIEDKLPFTDDALQELNSLYQKVDSMLERAIKAFENEDKVMAREVIDDDKYVDDMEKELRHNHITRINTKRCHPHSGVFYLDIISNFERIADHATNIAEIVVEASDSKKES